MRFLNKLSYEIVRFAFSLLICVILMPSTGFGQEVSEEVGIYSDYFEEFTLEQKFEQKDSRVYIFSGKNQYLNIEVISGIDSNSADTLTESEIMGIKALYANALSPYPGEVSREIVCNDRYKPAFRDYVTDGRPYKYVLLHSTERFGLGACTDDSVKYKHLIGWKYCPQSSALFIIREFYPLDSTFDSLEKMFLSFSCTKKA